MSAISERLTVGVVSYNSSAFLVPCLRSVMRETSSLDARIVVVDNGSQDGSAEIVRREFPSVLLIALDRNEGYGAGCNRILEASGGGHVLLLNADVELSCGCLPPLIRFLADRSSAGIVGCKLLETDGRVQPSTFAFPTIRSYLLEAVFLERAVGSTGTRVQASRQDVLPDAPRRAGVVLGAFLLIRNAVIRAIGGMDPRFFMYSEETDYCCRAWKAGWETWYVPAGVAVHHGGKSVEGAEPEMFVENHKSKVLFMRIHHGRLSAAAARTALCLGALIRSCLWAVLSVAFILLRNPAKEKARRRVRMFSTVLAWHFGLQSGRKSVSSG